MDCSTSVNGTCISLLFTPRALKRDDGIDYSAVDRNSSPWPQAWEHTLWVGGQANPREDLWLWSGQRYCAETREEHSRHHTWAHDSRKIFVSPRPSASLSKFKPNVNVMTLIRNHSMKSFDIILRILVIINRCRMAVPWLCGIGLLSLICAELIPDCLELPNNNTVWDSVSGSWY